MKNFLLASVALLLAACAADEAPPATARSPEQVRALAREALCAQALPATRDAPPARGAPPSNGEDPRVTRAFAFIAAARLSSDQGFYLNAEACADQVLATEPRDAKALSARAIVLLNRHRFAEALEVSRQALALDTDDVLALGNASDALMETGQYPAAREYADKQLRLAPNMASLSRGAYLRWLAGETDAAKLMLRDALKLRDAREPEAAAWTFVDAATVYWHQGDLDGADALAREALNWVADYPPALVLRARVALSRGDAVGAVASLREAASKRPLVETFWLLGDAQARAGDTAAARQAYDQALQLGRRGDRLMLGLFLAARAEHIDEALRALQAEREQRDSIAVDDAYALALSRAGRHAEAVAMSDRALRLNTPDARLRFHRGLILLAARENERGRAALREALAINPYFDSAGAEQARSLLASDQAVAKQ